MADLAKSEMLYWLNEKDPLKLRNLFSAARACTVEHVGPKVYLRGLVELSNFCRKNCYYCGIRSKNTDVCRYSMVANEILECAREALEMNYGSIVLQAGEREDKEYVNFIEDIVRKIKGLSNGRLGITLSLGEQVTEVYERWFRAGAHRYLLRIETSNPKFYRQLHPHDHSYAKRLACLRVLRSIGYQTGTGVMIGLPSQTHEDLVNDILFFKHENIDMIGMGPYIPHKGTPLSGSKPDFVFQKQKSNLTWTYNAAKNLRLGLVMISLARLYLKNVNIAAATALQAIEPEGREKGVEAGANVIMPNLTPIRYRGCYQLYNGKPCLDENTQMCSECLDRRIRSVGAEIGYGEWGDSPHFTAKQQTVFSYQ